MASRLLNVRLTPEDEALVARLKARGISISDVMRRALRAEAASIAEESVDPDKLIAELQTRFPTPSGAPRRRVRSTDRSAVRAYIQRKLRRS